MYARYQAAIADLTASVLADSELAALMCQAAALVTQTLAVAYGTIWELLPGGSVLELREASGWPVEAVAGMTATAAATSPIGAAVLGAAPVLVADWASETRFEQPELLREAGIISSLAVAIPGPGRAFGGLNVDVTASRIFSDEEVQFLRAVAHVLALAIQRSPAADTRSQPADERTQAIEQQLIAAAQERAVLEERQRLARDLHDSMTQALYSITLHAQGIRGLLASGDIEQAGGALCGLQDIAQEALDEMRMLIFELRPPALEQVGLVAALQARLNAVEGRAKLKTKLVSNGIAALPPPIEQALYRIAQEGLNNALKHAHARHITIQLRHAQQRIVLEIGDDGVGFNPSQANHTGGLGLRGIVERVAQLDGIFAVRSTPGAGTTLHVEVEV